MIFIDACFTNDKSFVCPAPPFQEPSVVKAISNSLTPNGTFAANCLYPNNPSLEEHRELLQKFNPYFRQCIIEDARGNFVLACSNQDIPKITSDYLKYRRKKIDKQVKELFKGDFMLIL